jgi:hypothetical protein
LAKLSLTDLANLTNESSVVAAINANNAAIEAAVEKTLSRDGEAPNSMDANLDMNSYRIQNLPLPVGATEPVRKGEFDQIIDDMTAIYNDAAALYDEFDDRFLGAKGSEPALDNDGDALEIGALYYNTSANRMMIYQVSGWTAIGSTWFTGSGAPSDASGQNGDFYIQATGEVYQKSSGTWGAFLFTLKGADGVGTIHVGTVAPVAPAVNDLWVDTN